MLVALATAGLVVVHRRVLGIERRPSWPPPPDAVTADGAQAATEAFAARASAGPRDAALDFAWSTAATLEPWADGENFFPRILADVEAARSSVHILMFGWREGEVGMRMAALLERKLSEGVEVRVIVDGLGSRPYMQAREMFTRLAAAGAEIVVNDVLPPERVGLFPAGRPVWRLDQFGRADHRKLYVIDGHVAWTGGAGIEDHFNDGRFHDLMVRVTGDVVRQAQAAFLTSFRGHGGPLPADLSPSLPRAARTRLDTDRPRSGDPRRLRRRLAGRPGADRRGARAPRRDEPLPHRPRHHRAAARGRAARREGAGRRLRELQQPRGVGGAEDTDTRISTPQASRCGRCRAPSSTPRS